MRVGISVECAVCGRTKKPCGRDSRDNGLCSQECEGYRQDPQVGSLWPGETEAEFGFSVSVYGTKEVVELPCLYCGEVYQFAMDSNEANGIFNVFCRNGECEDKYAATQ